MPSWALKVSAVFITLFVLAGSFEYASGHLKNANAPLQPPVAERPAAVTPTPGPTLGPLVSQRPGQRTLAPVTPGPRLTIAPGVRNATLAPLTFTHVS